MSGVETVLIVQVAIRKITFDVGITIRIAPEEGDVTATVPTTAPFPANQFVIAAAIAVLFGEVEHGKFKVIVP